MAHIVYRVAATEAEREGHFAVRRAVFVEEQGLFVGSDLDEHDRHAVHLVAVDEDTGEVIGAVRCYEEGDGTWFGGRLAVLQSYRRETALVGPRLVKLAEEVVRQRGCRRFLAYVQMQNVRFFERLGWRPVGEPELHHRRLHQTMEALSISAVPARPLVHV